MGSKMKELMESSGITVGLLIGEILAAGLQLLSKIIITQQTFLFALMAYRHLLATFCVLPFALYFERGAVKKMSWSACLWLFMVALTGMSMGLGFFYCGQTDTTATYANNFLNLIPIVTFVFSIILRIEKVKARSSGGSIKIGGAILCFGGALIISLYKGKILHVGPRASYEGGINRPRHNYKRGTLFLVASILSYATRFIMQVKLSKAFPYKYWATTIICMMASIQQALIGLCVNRKAAAWALEWNMELLWITSGAMVTIVTSCLVLWAVAKRGPTYPSMFNPLSLILVAAAEALFLHQDITTGSLLGMSFIIVGLYMFLWAKNKESEAPPSTELPIIIDQPKEPVFPAQSSKPLVN